MRYILLTILIAAASFAWAQPSTRPATRPISPPPRVTAELSRMTAELTGPVSMRGEVPLTLKLFSEGDGRRRYNNYSFMFVLLDEHGQQVGGPHVFIREAITVVVELDGRESTYMPRLVFYPDRKGLVAGRKYQLGCLMPPCDLATAVWFKLTD